MSSRSEECRISRSIHDCPIARGGVGVSSYVSWMQSRIVLAQQVGGAVALDAPASSVSYSHTRHIEKKKQSKDPRPRGIIELGRAGGG